MILSRLKKRTEAQPQRRAYREPAVETERPQFRRNQTLSGIRRHEDGTSERTRVHHLASRRRKMLGVFGIVLAAIVLLTILLTQFMARVTIGSATQQVSRPVTTSVYEERINEYLAINPVERLRFLLNEPALTSYVAATEPEVALIELGGMRQLTDAQFTITFREPIAGWQINNRQYYVDSQGVVFEENYFTPSTVQIVDESGISPEAGTAVASARLLSFVGRAVSVAGEGGYNVTSVTLPSGTTRQLELRLENVQPFIRLTIDRAVGEQIEDMIRSINFLRERGRSAEYIDVRVEGRAVYR